MTRYPADQGTIPQGDNSALGRNISTRFSTVSKSSFHKDIHSLWCRGIAGAGHKRTVGKETFGNGQRRCPHACRAWAAPDWVWFSPGERKSPPFGCYSDLRPAGERRLGVSRETRTTDYAAPPIHHPASTATRSNSWPDHVTHVWARSTTLSTHLSTAISTGPPTNLWIVIHRTEVNPARAEPSRAVTCGATSLGTMPICLRLSK